jgi:multicomponent Na+:H+ antiporter subunit G
MVDILVMLVSWMLTAIACVFIVSGAVGLVRMPDLYTRLHAASITDTGGTIMLSLALLLQALLVFDNPMAAIKVVLILFFTLFSAPTASHALAKTALLCGHIPTDSQGKPLLESSEEATRLARSRPADYQHGEDAKKIEHQLTQLDRSSEGNS